MEGWSIVDFMEEFYGYKPVESFGIQEWQKVKDKFGIKEKHYASPRSGCELVEFDDIYGGSVFYWCETPKKRRNMGEKISNAGGIISWLYK